MIANMLNVDYRTDYGEIILQESDGTMFVVNIHSANALCAFIYHYEEGGKKWAQLMNFLADKVHIENIMKNYKEETLLQALFAQEVLKVRINTFHKNARILLRYLKKSLKEHNDNTTIEEYYKEENI